MGELRKKLKRSALARGLIFVVDIQARPKDYVIAIGYLGLSIGRPLTYMILYGVADAQNYVDN